MTDLWTEATHDAEAEQMSRQVTAARVSAVDLWPFLAAAEDQRDFENRKAIVADRLDRIVSTILPNDPVGFGVVRSSLEASLDEDFALVTAGRQEEAEARTRIEAAVAERETRARVEATLQQKRTKTAASDTGSCGTCGRATSYDKDSRKWTHDNEGPDTNHPVTKAAAKTAATEGPWKAQVAGNGENVWSENALRFETEEEAKAYISNLSMNWFGFDLGRVVPADTPNREPVDLDDPKITHNFRTGSKRTAGFPPAGDAQPAQPAEQQPAAPKTVERRVDQDPDTGEFVGSEWVEKEGDPNTLVQSDTTFGKNPRFPSQEEAEGWKAETSSEEQPEEAEETAEKGEDDADTTKTDPAKTTPPAQFEKKTKASKTAVGQDEPENDFDPNTWHTQNFGGQEGSREVDGVTVHTFASTAQAYNESQVSDSIKDGDVLYVPSEGVAGVLNAAWPIAVTEAKGEFHGLSGGYTFADIEGGKYAHAAEVARQVAGGHTASRGRHPFARRTASSEDYDKGYALGKRHLEKGLPYNLPFGLHIDGVRGYQDGYEGRDHGQGREARKTAGPGWPSNLTIGGVEFTLDKRNLIGWMSDWGAPWDQGWIDKGWVETVDHNSGGLGGLSFRLTDAGRLQALKDTLRDTGLTEQASRRTAEQMTPMGGPGADWDLFRLEVDDEGQSGYVITDPATGEDVWLSWEGAANLLDALNGHAPPTELSMRLDDAYPEHLGSRRTASHPDCPYEGGHWPHKVNGEVCEGSRLGDEDHEADLGIHYDAPYSRCRICGEPAHFTDGGRGKAVHGSKTAAEDPHGLCPGTGNIAGGKNAEATETACAYCGSRVQVRKDDQGYPRIVQHKGLTKGSAKTAAGPIRWVGDTHFGVGYVKGKAANGDNYEVYFNPNMNPTPCSWVNYGSEHDGDTAPLNAPYKGQGRGFTTMQEAMRAAEADAAGTTASKTAETHAPYRIQQDGDKWKVVNDIGETKGTHDSKEEAREHQKALYANVEGASEQAEKKSSARTATADLKVGDPVWFKRGWMQAAFDGIVAAVTPNGYEVHGIPNGGRISITREALDRGDWSLRPRTAANPYSVAGNPYVAPMQTPGTPDDVLDGPADINPPVLDMPMTTRPRQRPNAGQAIDATAPVEPQNNTATQPQRTRT